MCGAGKGDGLPLDVFADLHKGIRGFYEVKPQACFTKMRICSFALDTAGVFSVFQDFNYVFAGAPQIFVNTISL